jgi:hypothetical protein
MKLSVLVRVAAVAAALLSRQALATTDEIQVYNAQINEPGQFSIELHNNYAIKAKEEPDHHGGMVPNHALNGTPEFAYGVKEWWELGLYLPYARTNDGEFHQGGFKLRSEFVSPHAADRPFFYGANFELSWQPQLFQENRWNLEIRPIIGVRYAPIEFIVNPIVDASLSGDHKPISFAPAVRLAYLLSEQWDVGIEHYSDIGPFDNVPSFAQQDHTVFLVADYSGEAFGVNLGVGRGYTSGAEDQWIVKMILEHDF